MKVLPGCNEVEASDYCAFVTFQEQNISPGNPFTGGGTRRRATTGLARLIIALLVVLIVAVATVGAWLIWGRGGDDDSATSPVAASSSAVPETESEAQPEIDSVALLENAQVDSVNPAPVPESVEAWGDYVKNRSWNGMLRVFELAEASPVTEEGGSQFRNTMNHCGEVMYLVTFRSVNENVLLDAQLLDAAKSVRAHAELHDGWMLGTNCELPQFVFVSSTDTSNLGDVAYDVTEYRQSSVAAPAAGTAAEPTFVACDDGMLTAKGRYSDGSWRDTPECDTEQHRRAVRAEAVCGGPYPPAGTTQAEYAALCGGSSMPMPLDTTPAAPVPSPVPSPVNPPAPAPDPGPGFTDPGYDPEGDTARGESE